MMRFHKITSTCFGIGYVGKGGGTLAALATCIAWYFIFNHGNGTYLPLIVTIAITILGIWSSNKVTGDWGKDPSKVVIDESAGMCISLLFLPVNIYYVAAGLVLFRFFDIVKPLFIRNMEYLPGGWGIMFDDILAGIYSNLILQGILYLKLF